MINSQKMQNCSVSRYLCVTDQLMMQLKQVNSSFLLAVPDKGSQIETGVQEGGGGG